jgi:hypothetical protein
MIEIATEDLVAMLTFDEVKLYLFSLGDGWRLPAITEVVLCRQKHPILGLAGTLWSDVWFNFIQAQTHPGRGRSSHLLIPVRDLKDD